MKTFRICIGIGVALLLLNFIVSGFSVKSLTGFDIKNWFTHTETQERAYEIQVDYLRRMNLICSHNKKDAGGKDLAEKVKFNEILGRFEKDKNYMPTPEEEMCFEQVIKGSASPRDDVPQMIKGVKNAFATVISETVFSGDVFPQLGGAFITNAEAGYEYTISVSGRRSQRVFGPQKQKWYFTNVMADGKLPDHDNKTWIDPSPIFCSQILDGNQPVFMAVVIFDEQNYFAHNGLVHLIAKESGPLKLTANCQKEHVYFNESTGSWHVEVKRIKST